MGRILSYFIVISLITIIRTLLLRKGKPTISVIEWANASRLGLRYNDRTRSDQQEPQKRKVPETLDFSQAVVDKNETFLDFPRVF